MNYRIIGMFIALVILTILGALPLFAALPNIAKLYGG